MSEIGLLTISAEEGLWALLESALSERQSVPAKTLKVAGWNPRLLYFPDATTGHAITPTTATAILNFHASIERAYAIIIHGTSNRRALSSEEKSIFEINFISIDGSNGVKAKDIDIDALLQAMVTKMDGTDVVIVVVSFFLLYFGSTVTKSWIKNKYETKQKEVDAKERISLSEQETKRVELLTRAMIDRPVLAQASAESESAREALVRAALPQPRAQIIDTEITHEMAQTIVSKPREKGKGKRLTGNFEVVQVITENPDGYYIRLRDDSGKEFTASLDRMNLTDEDIDAAFYSAREKVTVSMSVNTWEVAGRIDRAAVMRASKDDAAP